MVQTGGSYKYLFLVTAKKSTGRNLYVKQDGEVFSNPFNLCNMCENILPNIGSVQQIQKPERRNFE